MEGNDVVKFDFGIWFLFVEEEEDAWARNGFSRLRVKWKKVEIVSLVSQSANKSTLTTGWWTSTSASASTPYHPIQSGIIFLKYNEPPRNTRAMNSRSSSISLPYNPNPRLHQRRPSFSSRLSIAITTAEAGEPTTNAEHQIDEEIEEIKRYEVRAIFLF